MVVWIALTFIAICIYLTLTTLKPKKFPPGPSWKPFVGCRHDFKRASQKTGYQHLALSQLANNWKTNILGLKLGNELVVAVEDFPTIEHILNSKEYDQRPINFFIKLRNMGTNKGITCAQGHLWSEQRQFLARYINVISNKQLDFNINSEVQNVFQEINCDEPIDIMGLLRYTVFNILWSMVAGRRICSGSFEKNHLLSIMSKRLKAFDMAGGILSQYPWLRFIIPERSGYNLIKTLNREVKNFLMETIEEHRQTWTDGSDFDFVHTYLTKMRESRNENYTDEQLFFVCLDLFIGGFSTTALTLGFVFLMMMLHQDVQSKIQALLDENFDDHHAMEYKDRYKVPYIKAVITEVQRYRNISPIFGPRATVRDTYLAGYIIPKVKFSTRQGSMVIFFLGHNRFAKYAPHMDGREIWGDPEVFRPERFLDERGQFTLNPKFVPFGLGRRKCPADSFAQRSLFLITAKILRQYKVVPVDQNNLPSMAPVPGMLQSPTPYSCRLVKRIIPTPNYRCRTKTK